MEGKKISIDVILKILGNETRRNILRLLSFEPHYPHQIAQQLQTSDRAIMKHISLFEEYGFVVRVDSNSDLKKSKGKSRNYFKLAQGFDLFLNVSPHGFRIITFPTSSPEPEAESPKEIGSSQSSPSMSQTKNNDDDTFSESIEKASFLIDEIEKEIVLKEKQLHQLYEKRRRVACYIDNALQPLIPEYKRRLLIRHIFHNAAGISIRDLSTTLDVSESSIYELLRPYLNEGLLKVTKSSDGQTTIVNLSFDPF